MFQAFAEGVKIGPVMDLCNADETSTREYALLDFWPDVGKYTLRLGCLGKSNRSAGHYRGVVSVRLREHRTRAAGHGSHK